MTLLAPWLAAFAALAAVPVIIHLLNRRRFKVVRWGAMDFLLRSLQRTRRRLQLQDLILLLLRVAALVLAALACSRPALPAGRLAGVAGAGGATTVVVLDNSLSMGVAEGGATRFARAQQRAAAAIRSLPPGSAAALVLLSDVAVSELAEPSRDLELVAGLVARAAPGDGATAVPAALVKAAELLKAGAGVGEVVLVTDCQANGWPAAADPAWEPVRQGLRGAHLVVCDVGGPPPANAGLARLAVDDAIVAAGADCAFTAVVARRGTTAALPVALWVDDGRGGPLVQAAGAVAEAGEGAQAVRLAHRFPHGGRFRVEARLPADALAADDRRALVVEVVERVRVCVVAQGRAGGFLQAALTAGGDGDGGEGIEVALLSPDRLADLNLDEYRAIILAGVADPSRLAEALRTAVGDGRGLLLMPGPASDPAAWNRSLGDLLPARLSERPLSLDNAGFATDRLDHPVTSFFAAPEHLPWLAQPRFRNAWGLEPAAGAQVLLRLAGGQPWLAERAWGRGVVDLAAGPADRDWGDLPLRPAFVMLVRRLVQRAALGTPPRLNLQVHDALRLGVPAREAAARFQLVRPDGGTASLSAGSGPDGRPQVESADTGRAGFYAVGVQGAAAVPFAVAAQAAESDLAHAGPDILAPCLAPLPTAWIGPDEDVGERLARGRTGVEIWPLLLILAGVCLAAESLLAARWSPRER